MRFSFNWFKDYLEYALPPQDAADLLTRHAFEVESITGSGEAAVFDIDVRPNRAGDAFSHMGIARELNAIVKARGLTYPRRRPPTRAVLTLDYPPYPTKSDRLAVKIVRPADCPRYTAAVVERVAVTDSPDWLKQRLQAVGVQPINNVVDVTNYVMLTTGQPIHAFDFDQLRKASDAGRPEIIVRRAEAGERIKALDGVTYSLDPEILVISSAKRPLAIAGIKGGETAGISRTTRVVLLESANFDSVLVYQGAKKIKLKTDASIRFAHGVPPALTRPAMEMAIDLLKELAGGRAAPIRIDQQNKVVPATTKILVNPARVSALLGTEVTAAEAASLLRSLGCVLTAKKGALIVRPPWYRRDLQVEEDVVEEVGRLFGYDRIPARLPRGRLDRREREPFFLLRKTIKQRLTGYGYDELYLYSMVREELTRLGGIARPRRAELSLVNPISRERAYLRPSLLPGLSEATRENLKHYDRVMIFEIGKIFRPRGRGEIAEEWALALAAADKKETLEKTYQYLRGTLDGLAVGLGLDDWRYLERKGASIQPMFSQGQDLAVESAGRQIGTLGVIDGDARRELRLKLPLVLAEIELEPLLAGLEAEREYQAPPRYPAVLRDVSLLVPGTVPVGRVLNIIHRVGKQLIEDVDLFDVYQGRDAAGDKKSLAFHIIYRSAERTLSDDEVSKLQDRIEQALVKELEAEIR